MKQIEKSTVSIEKWLRGIDLPTDWVEIIQLSHLNFSLPSCVRWRLWFGAWQARG